MDFMLIDLFGGTIEMFESEHEALQAANELLERYRQQATIDEWHNPDYMSGIMVTQVSHRATRVNSLHPLEGVLTYPKWDYAIRSTQRPPGVTKLMVAKA